MTNELAALLPDIIKVEQTTTDAPDNSLLQEEFPAIARAVKKRRAEFTTVRECARRALSRLGLPPVPIVPGRAREPQWPVGVVGSLTHCDGYRAAAVAHASEILTIGIDAEIHQPLPDGIEALITTRDESLQLDRLARELPHTAWDRMLLSAKESIYKAWYPLSQTWLDFTECELHIDAENRSFTGTLLRPGISTRNGLIDRFTGQWAIQGNCIVTAVFEPRK